MRAKLLLALCLLAALSAVPAAAEAWEPCNCALCRWLHPPQDCCAPPWQWIYLRPLRPYPNANCNRFRGTLEPYDDNGLLLPPSSRPGWMPPSDPANNPADAPKSLSRTPRMRADIISTRK